MRDLLINALYYAQKAQRNYDHSKEIPEEDLKLLIYAATICPSKQNEVHYRLNIITDKEKINEIYFHTKNFSLFRNNNDIKEQFSDENGIWKFDQSKCVRNSQVKANILFVYEDYSGQARGGDHILATRNSNSVTYSTYARAKDTSIGISVGELILTANLLGYRTGISSGFDDDAVRSVLNTENSIKLLVGIGYENKSVNRRTHPDVLNKDVPESFRTGDLEDGWKFPSFYKNIPVVLNGIKYNDTDSICLINQNKSIIIR
jgi:nitroreductase